MIDQKTPLYNIRILKIYLDYLEAYYPGVDTGSVLEQLGLTDYELNDSGHWLSQEQVDHFQELVVEKTGNKHIARETGRFLAQSKTGVMQTVVQFGLGLLSPMFVYMVIEKMYPTMSRGAVVTARNIGSHKVEIKSVPAVGAVEKPYQCENRFGSLECATKFFTGKLSTIEHTECYHRGDACCRYIISWEQPAYFFWKWLRKLLLAGTIPVGVAGYFYFPVVNWLWLMLVAVCSITAVSFLAEYLEKREQVSNLRMQGDSARLLLDEMNMRYSNAILMQKLGRITSTVFSFQKIVAAVMEVLKKHLDFDNGLLLMLEDSTDRLEIVASYGYDNSELQAIGNHLGQSHLAERLYYSRVQRHKAPFFANSPAGEINTVTEILAGVSPLRTVHSIVCVPILHEDSSIGVLALENRQPKRQLTQSDINLLSGVASQTAVSIMKARVFEKLRESEEKHRLLVETIRDIVYTTDTSGHFTYLSPMVETITGYAADELLGTHFLAILDAVDHARILEIFYSSLETPRIFSDVVEIIAKDGRKIPCEVNSTTLFDPEGTLVGQIGVARDITRRRLAEESRQEMEVKALSQAKLASLGEIATGIAHEINQPLTYIKMMFQTALQDLESGGLDLTELRGEFGESLRQTARISQIVTHLRTFGRSDASTRTPIALSGVLDDAMILIRERLRLKNIAFFHTVEDDLPLVQGNAVQLEQVFVNLFQNSIDVLEENQAGRIAVEMKRCGNSLVVRFSDDGRGMAAGIRERIFEPFFTTKAIGRGTGIGLSIVYGIIKEHEGSIECNSEPGIGTEFVISLPCSQPELQPVFM